MYWTKQLAFYTLSKSQKHAYKRPYINIHFQQPNTVKLAEMIELTLFQLRNWHPAYQKRDAILRKYKQKNQEKTSIEPSLGLEQCSEVELCIISFYLSNF